MSPPELPHAEFNNKEQSIRRRSRSLTPYVVSIFILAILGLLSTTSVKPVTRLNDLRVIHSQWHSPQSPHHASGLPPYMRPTLSDHNNYPHGDHNPDADSELDRSTQSTTDISPPSNIFPRMFSNPSIFPASSNVSHFQRPFAIQCSYAAVITVVASVPPTARLLAKQPDWCVILIMPSAQTYSVAQSHERILGHTDDVISAPNVIALNASLVDSLPYDTAKLYTAHTSTTLSVNRGYPSTTESSNADNSSANAQSRQHDMSAAAMASDTYALVTLNNIAYLLAAHHGAHTILEVWPDVEFYSLSNLTQFMTLSNDTNLPLLFPSHHWFNPHPHFNARNIHTLQTHAHSWPRGFPLGQIWNDNAAFTGILNDSSVNSNDIGIITSLVDVHPDVDATIAMTTDQLPLIFRASPNIALPTGRFVPLSSACSAWRASSFPLLFLAPGTPVRMIDIFRGLIAQRGLHAAGQHVAFLAPVSTRHYDGRRPWDSRDVGYDSQMSDFFNELLQRLGTWNPQDDMTLAQFSLHLYQTLADSGVISVDDVSAGAKWLNDLRRVMQFDGVFATPLNGSAARATAPKHQLPSSSTNSALRRGPKIAVCITGDMGSLGKYIKVNNSALHGDVHRSRALGSPNMTVGHALWHNLLIRLGHFDAFVISDDNATHTVREGESVQTSVCDLLKPSYAVPYSCTMYDLSEDEGKWSSSRLWRRFSSMTPKNISKLNSKLHVMHACKTAVESSAQKHGASSYDWGVFVDSGAYVDGIPTLETLMLDERNEKDGIVWTTSSNTLDSVREEHREGMFSCSQWGAEGEEESKSMVAIGHWKHMSWWLNALELIVAHIDSSSGEDWSVDEALGDILSHKGIVVREHVLLHACTVMQQTDYRH